MCVVFTDSTLFPNEEENYEDDDDDDDDDDDGGDDASEGDDEDEDDDNDIYQRDGDGHDVIDVAVLALVAVSAAKLNLVPQPY